METKQIKQLDLTNKLRKNIKLDADLKKKSVSSVLLHLTGYYNHKQPDKLIYPKIKTISEETMYSSKTVINALKTLQTNGYIEIKQAFKGKYNNNHGYKLTSKVFELALNVVQLAPKEEKTPIEVDAITSSIEEETTLIKSEEITTTKSEKITPLKSVKSSTSYITNKVLTNKLTNKHQQKKEKKSKIVYINIKDDDVLNKIKSEISKPSETSTIILIKDDKTFKVYRTDAEVNRIAHDLKAFKNTDIPLIKIMQDKEKLNKIGYFRSINNHEKRSEYLLEDNKSFIKFMENLEYKQKQIERKKEIEIEYQKNLELQEQKYQDALENKNNAYAYVLDSLKSSINGSNTLTQFINKPRINALIEKHNLDIDAMLEEIKPDNKFMMRLFNSFIGKCA